MNFKPLYDNVIVTRSKSDTVSKGGIYIPPTAQEKTSQGIVVAVGDGQPLDNGTVRPLTVKVGDTVLFDKFAASDININNEEYVFLRESSIVCVLN